MRRSPTAPLNSPLTAMVNLRELIQGSAPVCARLALDPKKAKRAHHHVGIEHMVYLEDMED